MMEKDVKRKKNFTEDGDRAVRARRVSWSRMANLSNLPTFLILSKILSKNNVTLQFQNLILNFLSNEIEQKSVLAK